MINPQTLLNDLTVVRDNLAKRNYQLDTDKLLELESQRKIHQSREENLRADRNKKSKEVSVIKREQGDASAIISQVEAINTELKQIEKQLPLIQKSLHDFYLDIPNLLHSSVPLGHCEDDNIEVKKHGKPTTFDFTPLDHTSIGENLAMLDFSLSSKIASSRFMALSGGLARLHRALAQFMLDHHITKNGYREVYLPFMANSEALTGTGQLPKFEKDLFFCERDQLYLIPTAEVVVTNVLSNTIVNIEDLPMRFVCHTPCFRREAGSYGRDTRGMLRQHQFEKVELVHLTMPDSSYDSLEDLLKSAESVLQCLDLPYRVVSLCSQDVGFSAAKTYDIEVWLPGQDAYREISSCSNCEDFQARRMKSRFKNEQGKNELIHTLNGSGVAVGRAMIAVMENYQNKDGSITVPEMLRPYMSGLKTITT